jgi:Tfp pilus assembly protein PilN
MVDPLEQEALEEEFQPQPRRSSLVLWLVILCLGILILPMVLLTSTIRDLKAPLQSELEAIEATLVATPAPPPDEAELNAQLLEVLNQTRALEAVSNELAVNPLDWPNVMAALLEFKPQEMQISGIAQGDGAITLTGAARSERVVMDYVLTLQENETFERVAIQSMELAYVPTSTPPAPVMTLTPELASTTLLPPVTPLFRPESQSVSFTLHIELHSGAL